MSNLLVRPACGDLLLLLFYYETFFLKIMLANVGGLEFKFLLAS